MESQLQGNGFVFLSQLPSQQAPSQQQQQDLTPQEHAVALIAYLAGSYNQNVRANQNRNQLQGNLLQSLNGGGVAQRNSGLQHGMFVNFYVNVYIFQKQLVVQHVDAIKFSDLT